MPGKKKPKPTAKVSKPKAKAKPKPEPVTMHDIAQMLPLTEKECYDRLTTDLMFRVSGMAEPRWRGLEQILAHDVENGLTAEDRRETYLALIQGYTAQVNARKIIADTIIANRQHNGLKDSLPEISDADAITHIAGLLAEHKDVIESGPATVPFESAAKADGKESDGGRRFGPLVAGAGEG